MTISDVYFTGFQEAGCEFGRFGDFSHFIAKMQHIF